jgi:hypothetical protein
MDTTGIINNYIAPTTPESFSPIDVLLVSNTVIAHCLPSYSFINASSAHFTSLGL